MPAKEYLMTGHVLHNAKLPTRYKIMLSKENAHVNKVHFDWNNSSIGQVIRDELWCEHKTIAIVDSTFKQK